MNLITSLATNIKALTIEDPAQPLQPYSVLMDMLGMTITDSGMMVNEKTALRQPTVLACIRVKSQGLSSLPLVVYERQPGGKRREAPEHKLYPVLRYRPNPQMASMAWREGAEAQRQMYGNTYTEIQRDNAGRVVALWPLPSDKTNAERVNGQLRYVTTATPGGERRYIEARNMLHIPGMAFDGLTGISPIQIGKQTIGRALAMERFGAQFFGNGVRPSGAFVYSNGALKPEQRENLRQSLQSSASGMNALRPLLLENGMDWKQMSIPNNEAQFVEAMAQVVADIARLFGVPLHLIQDLSRATNNNIEQQALEFVMYGLRPDAIKWEQEINWKLFAGTEFYCEHSMKDLLRGDFKTRMEGWATLFQTGAVSPNNICEVEGWNPIPEEEGGDMRFVPMNMIPLHAAKEQADAPETPETNNPGEGTPDDPAEPADPKDPNAELRRERVMSACRHLFKDAVSRTCSRAKRDKDTVNRIWQPVLAVAAGVVALCVVGDSKLPEAAQRFANSYAGDVWTRAGEWKSEDVEAVTEQELSSAYDALLKHIAGGETR